MRQLERLLAGRPKFKLPLGQRKENCAWKGEMMTRLGMAGVSGQI
jgi:hypothetical protein